MERLMMIRLQARGCAAEVQLNGLSLARVGAEGGSVTLPVHEYAVAGRNRLSFTAGPQPLVGEAPPAQPKVGDGTVNVRVVLALCHQGQAPQDPNARVLSQLSWTPGQNETHDWPFSFGQDVELPVNFPRWRWLEAPVITQGPALQRQVLELLQGLALDLQRGDPDSLLAAARLRTEELALAYQRAPNAWVQEIRDHVQQLFEAQALTVQPPEPDGLLLRPVAGGRLVECLGKDGGPALRTAPGPKEAGEAWSAWPLRLAQVEGKLYILR
ncbi:MAG: hypothetical protein WAQ08_01760 [Aquabacterium sp.]|jgi:hypothetical protein|uniref:hypothetical protein n=1 Tax=Aquabacterium sp. TaxID=1872578 RepID=UPI003BB02161